MVNFIYGIRNKSKLNETIKRKYPNLRNSLSFEMGTISRKQINSASISLIKMFLSFGSKTKSKKFWNNYIDVQAIENTKDDEVKRLLDRSIRLMSNFSKVWIIMMVSFLLAVITLPN